MGKRQACWKPELEAMVEVVEVERVRLLVEAEGMEETEETEVVKLWILRWGHLNLNYIMAIVVAQGEPEIPEIPRAWFTLWVKEIT